jgi:MFS family permease
MQSLVAPALPRFQAEYHASENAAAWILSGYLLSASILTPVVGRFGDMYGKERMLLVVLGLLAVGTLVSALAGTIQLVIVGRVVQGVGGGVFPLGFSIIRDELPPARVPGALGFMSGILGAGAGAGITLSGVVVDNLSLHWLFWLPLIMILIAAYAVWRYVPESPVRTPGRIRWRNVALMTGGLGAILIAVTRAQQWGWTSGRTVGLMSGGLGLIVVWILTELHSPEPVVDMQMMRRRAVWTTNLSALFLGVGLFGQGFLISQLAELPRSTGFGFGADVTGAGLFLLPSTVMLLTFSSLAGRLEARWGSRACFLAGTTTTALADLVLMTGFRTQTLVYLGSGLLGVGIGLSYAAMINLIVSAVDERQTGVATGMNAIMRTIGGAFGSQIAASMLAGNISPATGQPTTTGFVVGFCALAGSSLMAIATAAAVPRTKRFTATSVQALGAGPLPPAPLAHGFCSGATGQEATP